MAVMCLLLREGKSQAVGKGTEDVWVDGKLGGKVELGHVQFLPPFPSLVKKQARKPRSYASSKLRLNYSLTGVKCRATSVANNCMSLASKNILVLSLY